MDPCPSLATTKPVPEYQTIQGFTAARDGVGGGRDVWHFKKWKHFAPSFSQTTIHHQHTNT